MCDPDTVYPVGASDAGKRLDHFLKEKIPKLSRTRIQEVIRRRARLSWDAPAKPSTPVIAGGEVRLVALPTAEVALDLPIPVLARGDGWLAVDKPAGIPVHPARGVVRNSLIRMIRRQENDPALRLVHRLDRETSGVLLLAASTEVARAWSGAFEHGLVHKEYLALVAGAVSEPEGEVDRAIGADETSRVYVKQAAGVGKPARTRWRVERRWADRTLLRVFPETGRRHQIRVHLTAIGHPVLGDPLYGRSDADYLALVDGTRDARAEEGGPGRQMLHCAVVDLRPADLPFRFEAPIPLDFLRAIGD